LENIIERALAICDGPAIERHHLPRGLNRQGREHKPRIPEAGRESIPMKSLQENERDYIVHMLKSVGGNKTKAAKLMGIDRVSLWRKLSKYKKEGLDIDRLFNH
jgi:two-component system response regulator HydG